MSKDDIKNAISKKEIYRYLGYGANEPDSAMRDMADEVLLELINAINPKSIYRLYPCKTDGGNVFMGELHIKSKNLAGNLAQCDMAAVLAATLGIEADKLLKRHEAVNMAKAVVAQACGAACIEAYCNLVQEQIRLDAQEKSGRQLFIRPRFSPGYGDLPLDLQKDIFAALECTKRIGITLEQSLFMYPTKSVTAFIGFTQNPMNCHIERCGRCEKTDCEFRL